MWTIPIRLFICITWWGVTQKWDTLSWPIYNTRTRD